MAIPGQSVEQPGANVASGQGISAASAPAQGVGDLRIERSGALVRLTFAGARPVLTAGTIGQLAAALEQIARDVGVYVIAFASATPGAFLTGRDVSGEGSAGESSGAARTAWHAGAHELAWHLDCFSKPSVALLNGRVADAGAALALYCTHRVAGGGFSFALPSPAEARAPDLGSVSALARLPGHAGVYLGLTGREIRSGDALALGFLTHCIPESEHGAITAALATAQTVDAELDDRHVDPGEGELAPMAEPIERCFSGATVEEIVRRLEAERACGGAHAAWAGETLSMLAGASPTALKVTLRHIREARAMDLRQTLAIDYRLACRMGAGGAGSGWRPDRLVDVSEAMLEDLFRPLGPDELILPTRQEMQAARV
jgi:enoyl-CoA hydratase